MTIKSHSPVPRWNFPYMRQRLQRISGSLYAEDYSQFRVLHSQSPLVSDRLYTRLQEFSCNRFSGRTPRYSLRFLLPQLMLSPTLTVIRMFGTFAYAQLIRGRFWDTLSRQLQHRGPDYVERCTFRNEPLSTDDNIILPARFPPLPPFQVEDVPQDEPLAKVREEDIKNVSKMVGWRVSNILTKYVYNRFTPCSCTFSLDAIIPLITHII